MGLAVCVLLLLLVVVRWGCGAAVHRRGAQYDRRPHHRNRIPPAQSFAMPAMPQNLYHQTSRFQPFSHGLKGPPMRHWKAPPSSSTHCFSHGFHYDNSNVWLSLGSVFKGLLQASGSLHRRCVSGSYFYFIV
jgi:hypothetical protein